MAFLTQAANRGSVSTGYDIDNSLKFERDNNEAVETTNQAAGNRKTWTFSAWIKRTALSEDYHTIFGAEYTNIQIMSNNRPRLVLYNGTSYYADPEMLLRDTSAWYHIVVQLDTTQSTAADRVKWWINGERVTTFNNSTYTNMTQNTDFSGIGQPSSYGSGGWLRLGRFFSGDEGFDGYMADVYYLNGTAAEADDFGEYDADSGIWIPKAYTGSGYGTQGFHYKFDNASNLGEDSSGEGHDANSLTNISAADQSTDTPTNNFSTGNPLGPFRVGHWNFTEGATYAQYAGGNDWGSFTNTMAVGSGKWYVEIKAGGSDLFIGAGSEDYNFVGAGNGTGFPEIYYGYTGTNSVGYHANNGDVYNNGTQVVIGTTYTTNDIISVALDMDNGKIYFAKNGTYINSQNPATGANSIALPDTSARYFIGGSSYGTGKNHRCNYGGYTSFSISSAASDANGYGTFEYAPPTGYYALCTKNLAEYG